MAMARVQLGIELSTVALVRPGDKLILSYARPPGGDEAVAIHAGLAELLPGVEVIIVADVGQMIVYRPEEEADHHGTR